MPAGNNATYLHLLKQHHASLTAASSLAAPHYALAIQSLTRCPVPMTSVEELDALEGFSAGVRRRLNEMIEAFGGLNKAKQTIEEDCNRKRGRRSLLQTLEELEAQEEQIRRDAETTASEASMHHREASKVPKKPDSSRSSIRTFAAPTKSRTSQTTPVEEQPTPSAGPKNRPLSSRHTSTYMPASRSGAWGILMGIYLLSNEDECAERTASNEATYCSREAIIAKGQKYCRASYTYTVSRKAGGGSASAGGAKYLTAWSAMKTLLNRGMVWQRGRPATFALSGEGIRVAREIAVKEGRVLDEDGGDIRGNREADLSDGLGQPVTLTSSSPRRPTLLDQLDDIDANFLLPTEVTDAQHKSGPSSDEILRVSKRTQPSTGVNAKPRRRAPVQASSEDENESIFALNKEIAITTDIAAPHARKALASVSNRAASAHVVPLKLPPKTKPSPINALFLPAKERPAVKNSLKLPPRTLPYQQQRRAGIYHERGDVIIIDD